MSKQIKELIEKMKSSGEVESASLNTWLKSVFLIQFVNPVISRFKLLFKFHYLLIYLFMYF